MFIAPFPYFQYHGHMTEIFGFIGTALIVLAYIPLIHHLVVKKCSACMNINTWIVWVIASVLILIHAIAGDDLVFQLFTVVTLFFNIITLLLAIRYKGRTCQTG